MRARRAARVVLGCLLLAPPAAGQDAARALETETRARWGGALPR